MICRVAAITLGRVAHFLVVNVRVRTHARTHAQMYFIGKRQRRATGVTDPCCHEDPVLSVELFGLSRDSEVRDWRACAEVLVAIKINSPVSYAAANQGRTGHL